MHCAKSTSDKLDNVALAFIFNTYANPLGNRDVVEQYVEQLYNLSRLHLAQEPQARYLLHYLL
jgi:hypothetical protein